MQRGILERLKLNTNDPMQDFNSRFASFTDIATLASAIYTDEEQEPTRAQIESTRRAVLKLRNAGLVETFWVQRQIKPAHGYWKIERQLLVARLPLDGEVGKKWRATWDERQALRRRALIQYGLLDPNDEE